MARFILRYLGRDVPLEPGDYVLGRAAECDVLVDDLMASRRHAVLHVRASHVSVEDLGSRNGVIIEGHLAEGDVVLEHGKGFTIGQYDFQILERARWRRERLPTMDITDLGKQALATIGEERSEGESTGTGMHYAVFLVDAERCLSRGDRERSFLASEKLVESLTETLRQRRPVDEHALKSATRHLLKLGELDGGVWIDRLVDVYSVEPRALPADALATIERLITERGLRAGKLPMYVGLMTAKLADRGAREQAILRQLRKLARLTSAPPPRP